MCALVSGISVCVKHYRTGPQVYKVQPQPEKEANFGEARRGCGFGQNLHYQVVIMLIFSFTAKIEYQRAPVHILTDIELKYLILSRI